MNPTQNVLKMTTVSPDMGRETATPPLVAATTIE